LTATDHSSTPLPAVIDLEASGFGTASYPIEVGLVLPDGRSFCSLITPAPDWQHWDAAAEDVHGISRDQLQQYGRPAREVAERINECLRDNTDVYSDAWYHDYTWLARLFEAAGTLPRFRLHDLRSLLSEQEMRDWHHTKERVQAESMLSRHRASNDARILQKTLLELRSHHPL
jgi:hypothetical protein